ncbi:hypothetical protein LOTGIDRAFT_107864, partial [Lottia gigantea]
GTIDKGYPKRNNGYSFEIGESAVKKILERHHVTDSVRFVSVCKKDSQEITDDDRKILLETCRISKEKKILITHGTDTMIETAKYLAAIHCDKIIILTGSFLPETFKDSDAEFNIGFALGALRTMKDANTLIAMNCRIFHHDNVYKDDVSGDFKELDMKK